MPLLAIVSIPALLCVYSQTVCHCVCVCVCVCVVNKLIDNGLSTSLVREVHGQNVNSQWIILINLYNYIVPPACVNDDIILFILLFQEGIMKKGTPHSLASQQTLMIS